MQPCAYDLSVIRCLMIHARYMQDTSGYVSYRKLPPKRIGNPPDPRYVHVSPWYAQLGMPNIPSGRETSPSIPFPPGRADGSADCLSLHTLVHGRLTVGVKRHDWVCVCEFKTGPHSTAALMQARPRGGRAYMTTVCSHLRDHAWASSHPPLAAHARAHPHLGR